MAEKLNNVLAIPQSGVYKSPLTVELDCPSVRVEPTTVATPLSLYSPCYVLNIAKVSSSLYFNNQSYNSGTGSLGIYNIANNTISGINTPYHTHMASIVNVNNNIYIIGGYNPTNSTLNNAIMKYEIGGTVSTVSSKLSQKLRSTPCVAIGKYIYIIGGYNGAVWTSSIQRYDTELDTIETMSYSLTYALNSASVAEYNGKIYVIGDMGTLFTVSVQVIDTVLETVSTTASLPVSKISGGGASVIGDYIYSFGGNVSGKVSNRIFKKYLLDDSSWVEEPYRLAYSRYMFGYTTDEKGYYHIIDATPTNNGQHYETGRFGLPSSDVEIRYTQTSDGTEPEEPTETTGTIYTAPITVSENGDYNLKAKAFSLLENIENSNVLNPYFYVTDKTIIELDYTEDLPEELPLSQFNSALKQYISFYSGVYVVDDSNVNVVIENDTETTKKVIFYVAYEEGENAYSGYFEKVVNVSESKTITYEVSLPYTIMPSQIIEENILQYVTFYEDGNVGSGTKSSIIKMTDETYKIQYQYIYKETDGTEKTIYTDIYEVILILTVIEIPSTISNVSKIIYFKKEDYREQTDINIFLYNFIGAGFNAYYK